MFRDDSLEVVLGEQQEETQNAFVGGENRWKFDTFTNWEFWWPSFPVLVYFKVTKGSSTSLTTMTKHMHRTLDSKV